MIKKTQLWLSFSLFSLYFCVDIDTIKVVYFLHENMKLISTLLSILLFSWLVFWIYNPTMKERQQIQVTWDLLLDLVDTKFDKNYSILLYILKTYEAKVQWSDRNKRILNSLKLLTITVMQNWRTDFKCPTEIDCLLDRDIPTCPKGQELITITKFDKDWCPIPCGYFECK